MSGWSKAKAEGALLYHLTSFSGQGGVTCPQSPIICSTPTQQGRPCQPSAGAEGVTGDPTRCRGAGRRGWRAPSRCDCRPAGGRLAACAHYCHGDPRGTQLQRGLAGRQAGRFARYHQVSLGGSSEGVEDGMSVSCGLFVHGSGSGSTLNVCLF